jgi:hypothetical protein
MMYVYAIADRPEEPLPSLLGLHDEGLAKVIWQNLVAIVSTFNGTRLAKSPDELWRHEEVVESLMGDRAVLPARFGTLLPSRQDVGDVLCRAYRTLAADIERVRGQVEIGMRFLTAIDLDTVAGTAQKDDVESATKLGTGSGSAFLRAKLAKQQALRSRQRAKLSLVRQAYESLASHANASRLDEEPEDRIGASAAFLLPRERLELFRDIVGHVANVHPELALLCTGPWPPYSFVTAGECATTWSEQCHAG